MSITTRCRRCGRAVEADRAAILSGLWRLCPACRDPQPPSGAAGVRPDARLIPAAASDGAAKES